MSDYGVVFALPFFLIATLWRERGITSLVEIRAGAVQPAALWIWFHSTAFGSPFVTANQFTNPARGRRLFFDPVARVCVAVVVQPVARPAVHAAVGVRRVLIAVPAGSPRARGMSLLAVGSLAGLLWMNGGFSGWHGGWCVGPRYLSVVFPAMAFALALVWRDLPAWAHAGLWILLGVALAFRILVFPFSSLAPEVNLWTYHLSSSPRNIRQSPWCVWGWRLFSPVRLCSGCVAGPMSCTKTAAQCNLGPRSQRPGLSTRPLCRYSP